VQEEEASSKVYPSANYVIVPNGLNVPESLPVRNGWLPDGRLRVMFLGRLAPKKGIDNLLHAVEKVDTPISLAVYGASTVGQGGKNYGEDMVNLAKELGILDTKVRFCGQVDGDAKNRAFLDADVCVIPSYSESFCIVVAEAMAMGLPVIVSDRLAWGEVAKRGCGLVVGNDPDSLAKALKEIRGMELETMGKLGWEWMKDEFKWKTIGFSMLSVYKKIITACESGN